MRQTLSLRARIVACSNLVLEALYFDFWIAEGCFVSFIACERLKLLNQCLRLKGSNTDLGQLVAFFSYHETCKHCFYRLQQDGAGDIALRQHP